jgi:hypothetical protein
VESEHPDLPREQIVTAVNLLWLGPDRERRGERSAGRR